MGGHSFPSPEPSVSFGHVVGEMEDFSCSQYRMFVNLGHPVVHAHFFPNLLIIREGREDGVKFRGTMAAS